MTMIYNLIKVLTFPGVYARCFWEQVVCRVSHTVVEDNRYLREGEICSHVEHELMKTPRAAFAMCFVPAFMNAIGAFALSLMPLVFLFIYASKDLMTTIVCAISYWFACSLFLNSYSLIEDAMNMMEKVYKHGNILQKVLYAPAAVLLYVGSYLERYNVTAVIVIVSTVALILTF